MMGCGGVVRRGDAATSRTRGSRGAGQVATVQCETPADLFYPLVNAAIKGGNGYQWRMRPKVLLTRSDSLVWLRLGGGNSLNRNCQQQSGASVLVHWALFENCVKLHHVVFHSKILGLGGNEKVPPSVPTKETRRDLLSTSSGVQTRPH